MNSVTPSSVPCYHINLDTMPYQGEHDETETAKPRYAYYSPVTRNKIKLGHPLDVPFLIQGNRNLRSHLERILTRMSEGHRVTKIEITRIN